MSDYDDDAFEREAEQEAVRAQMEAILAQPDLIAKMVAAQRQAMTNHPAEMIGPHICRPCTHKHFFLQVVNTLAFCAVLQTRDQGLFAVLDWAIRVPAIRVMAMPSIVQAAMDLLAWAMDPGQAPQPAWYNTGRMENEGGHV